MKPYTGELLPLDEPATGKKVTPYTGELMPLDAPKRTLAEEQADYLRDTTAWERFGNRLGEGVAGAKLSAQVTPRAMALTQLDRIDDGPLAALTRAPAVDSPMDLLSLALSSPVDLLAGLGQRTSDAAQAGIADALGVDLQGQKAALTGDIARAAAPLQAEIAAIPKSPASQAAMQSPTAGGFFEGLAADPLGVAADIVVPSAVSQAPALAISALTRNPAIATASAGASSYAMERGSGVIDYLAQRGVDVTNEAALNAALSNPEIMAQAQDFAQTRAGIIAPIDAAGLGLAGKVIAPGVRGLAGREAVSALVGQPVTQGLLGAGGDVAAQLATTGQVNAGSALSEFLGDFAMSPAETAPYIAERAMGGDSIALDRAPASEVAREAKRGAKQGDMGKSLASVLELAMRGDTDALTGVPAAPARAAPVAGANTLPPNPLLDSTAPDLTAALADPGLASVLSSLPPEVVAQVAQAVPGLADVLPGAADALPAIRQNVPRAETEAQGPAETVAAPASQPDSVQASKPRSTLADALAMSEDDYIAAVNPEGKRTDSDDIILNDAAGMATPATAVPVPELGFTDKQGKRVEVLRDVDGGLYAQQDGKTIGSIVTDTLSGKPETMNEVATDYQGRGIGTGLAKAMIRENPFTPAGSFSPAGEATRRKAFRELQAEQQAGTRERPLPEDQMDRAPVGSWVAGPKLPGVDTRRQVRDVPLADIDATEFDSAGEIAPDKRRDAEAYADRLRAGEEAPNGRASELPNGKIKLQDGHRRYHAARATGATTMRLAVSPINPEAAPDARLPRETLPQERAPEASGNAGGRISDALPERAGEVAQPAPSRVADDARGPDAAAPIADELPEFDRNGIPRTRSYEEIAATLPASKARADSARALYDEAAGKAEKVLAERRGGAPAPAGSPQRRTGDNAPPKAAAPASAPPAPAPKETSTKNAVMRAEREARGADPLPKAAPKSAQSHIDEAREVLREAPERGREVVEKLKSQGDASISVGEEAILMAEKMRLQTARDRAGDRAGDESLSDEAREVARREWAEHEDAINDIDQATLASGREWGRFGNLRQRMIREDFSLAALERKERVRLGRGLNPDEKAELAAYASRVKALEEELQVAQKALSDEQSRRGVELAYKALSEELVKNPKRQTVAGIKARAATALEALRNTPKGSDSRPAAGAGRFDDFDIGVADTDLGRTIRDIVREWKGDAPNVVVVQEADALPDAAKNGRDWQTVEGWYDGTDTVYLVASNIRNTGRGVQVLAHEAIGHYGVEGVLGREGWQRVLTDVARMRGDKASLAPDVRGALESTLSRYPDADPTLFARELLAVMAERGVTGGLMDRVLAAVRRFLRALGFKPAVFSDAELRTILADAVKRVRNANPGARDSAFRGPAEARGSKITEAEREKNFKAWSNNAPLVTREDAGSYDFRTGEKVVVEAVHGTARPDRIGKGFDARRATSGPMAFFTSDATIGSNYATGKQDTSLDYEEQGFATWFKVKVPGYRSAMAIDRAWWSLPSEVRARITTLAPRVAMDDAAENVILEPEGHATGIGNFDYEVKQARGNMLQALVESWLSSGSIYGNEQQFMDVLAAAGMPMDAVKFDSPTATYPALIPVHVAMQSPLVTDDMPADVIPALRAAAKRDRSRAQQGGADAWDKNTRTLREWVADFVTDDGIKESAWTTIPDKVTEVLRSLGYDGIVDTGGKNGGATHRVYIPFSEGQVKGQFNRGTYDAEKKRDLLYSRPPIDQTETPAFRKWFGQSRVVDADGKPLVVYHGTSATSLEQFEGSFAGSTMGSASGLDGFFFTADPDTAAQYAKVSEKNQRERNARFWNWQNIVPTYLSLQNPLVYKKQRGDTITLLDTLKRKVIADAKAAGHDGVIFEGFRDTPNGRGTRSNTYVAFRPEQIKSATGNSGAFDPNNPSILFSRPPIDPKAFMQLADVGAGVLVDGVTDYEAWAARMTEMVGDGYADALPDAFEAAKAVADSVRSDVTEMDPENVTQRDVANLARKHILAGVRGEDAIMRAVTKDVREAGAELDERDVRRLLSDYGNVKFPSKDEDKVLLRELRALVQMQESIDRLKEKLPALKSGPQRDKPTLEIREKRRTLNDLLKRAEKTHRNDPEKLATFQQARITNLRNAIEDLEKQLRTGERPVRAPAPPDTPEIAKLREQRDELLRQRRAVDNPRTPEQEKQRRALVKQIEKLEARLAGGPKAVRQKREIDAANAQLAAQRDQLRAELKALEEGPKLSPEERYQRGRAKALARQLADTEARIKANDYVRRTRPPPKELDKANTEAMTKLLQAKAEFARRQYEAEMAQRSPIGKAFGAVRETLNFSRAILTSVDFSGLLRQGGFITFAHPIRAAQAVPEMLRAFWGEAGAVKSAADLASRPNARLYKKYGLDLTEYNNLAVSQAKVEEAFQSRWVDKFPTLLGGGILRGSQRSYTTVLNRIRADSFDAMAASLGRKKVLTEKEGEAIANFINVATGRGKIGAGKRTTAATGLNTVFFAPRLVASRFNLLFGQPFYGQNARTALMLGTEYARFLTGVSVVFALAALAADEDDDDPLVTLDPRSSNFLKIKFNNTYIDPMTGLSQVTVFFSRVVTGEKVTGAGEVQALRAGMRLSDGLYQLGLADARMDDPGFGGMGVFDTITDFARSKLAPAVGMAVNALEQENIVGTPFGGEELVIGAAVPIGLQDIHGLLTDNGLPKGAALFALSMLGMGVQYRKPNLGTLSGRLADVDDANLQTEFDRIKGTMPQDVVSGAEIERYKNNAQNRKLGRAGNAIRDDIGRPRITRPLANEILAMAKNPPKTVRVDKDIESADVPPEIRASFARSKNMLGLFDPATKTVYVRKGLSKADEKQTAFHEIAGHYGLQGVLGEKYEPIMSRAMNNPTVRELAEAMGKRAYKGANQVALTEEALSNLAAAQRTGDYKQIEDEWGVKVPQSSRANLRGMLSRVVQMTKRAFGEKQAAMDDDEVYSLLEDAWQYVENEPKEP